ncbi:hypothetical protein [Psychroserpens luteolus]|uniref:hypothetical protein n=1 Tax=Psychroserpens luteolus TaxID=2855840 RepID=UPI001E571737|nr:hypothetical protein [Psychroserpens luteolus]MCD2258870.1 hypothetical protein [Psychroserpens luteolus]
MTDYSTNKPPVWFWIVSVLALIWNLLGVGAYLSRHFMTDEMIAELEPQLQFEMAYEHPAWYTAIFAIAVFGGVLGCLGLLLRKKWAYLLFIISFLCATAQQIYYVMEVEGTDKVMPIMIVIVCLFLIWFSKMAKSKTWIK